MTSMPCLFFSLIYEFTFHYIKEEIACLYVAYQHTQVSVGLSYSFVSNSYNFQITCKLLAMAIFFYPRLLINMASNVSLGNGVS